MTIVTPDDAIIAVGAVVYRDVGDGKIEFLLIKKRLGFWTLPKGGVKSGEDDPAAVAREVREETGLRGSVEEAVKQVSYTVFKGGSPRVKTVTYYLFHARKGGLQLSAREQITRARWFAPRAALRRIRRNRIRAIARKAVDDLTNRQQASSTE